MKLLYSKSIRYIVAIFALSIVLSAGGVAFKYYRLSQNAPEAILSSLTMSPSSKIKLGDSVTLSLTARCPWNVRPEEVELSPGKGTQSVGKPSLTRESLKWGSATWKISAEIQPYINGETEKGKISILFDTPVNGGKKALETEIPPFSVEPIDTGKSPELAIAGKIEHTEMSRTYLKYFIIGFILLLALVAILTLYFRSRKQTKALLLTPWQIAIIELCELRKNHNDGKLSASICFNRLTDIVRTYLEKRFTIKAPAQTTYEFLNDMKRHGSPLEERHRDFLSTFLQAADLVKFANLPADTNILDNAMDKAKDLVESSAPKENKEKR